MENKISEVYKNIKSTLEAENIEVSDYRLIDYGMQFTVFIADWSGLIRIYQNKKGVIKIDYSQLRDRKNATKIQNLIEGKSTRSNQKLPNSKKSIKKNYEFGFPIIGTDESGKGDYFGPLVSAGVYVDEQSAKDLIALGVKDSKKLSDSKALELAKKIAKICKGQFAIIEISPSRYNDLYKQFKLEGNNLNSLLSWGHAKAIEEILLSVDCKVAIADQFADERFIKSKLQERGKKIKLIQKHKAEQHIAVAGASILARARFLEKLSKLSDGYRIDLPKGASKKVIKNGKMFVDMHGKEALKNVAKLHFKTTDEVLNR